MEQLILQSDDGYRQLKSYLQQNGLNKPLLVCGKNVGKLGVLDYLDFEYCRFDNFSPNPDYSSVVDGIDIYKSNGCDCIIALGGGSAIDVAKCIKLFCLMDSCVNYLEQTVVPNDIKLIAIPTTAGTGSEATRFAVIYLDGVKQSVSDYSCIPEVVLFDCKLLKTLPEYQRKATMFDALCHAIESYWSVNSTEQSKEFACEAIGLLMNNMGDYLANSDKGNANMLLAANYAGKAINITQTTAGHAMCYKLTSTLGLAHGHAAALCVARLWPYMIDNTETCIDVRGSEYLRQTFVQLARCFGKTEPREACTVFLSLLDGLGLLKVGNSNNVDYSELVQSVNPVRLKNNPVKLTSEIIEMLYHQILM